MLRSFVIRGKALETALDVGGAGLLIGLGGAVLSHFTQLPMLMSCWVLMLVGACCGALGRFRTERGLWLFATLAGVLGVLITGALAAMMIADLAAGRAVHADVLVSLTLAVVGVVIVWSVFFENRRLAGRTVKVV